MLCPYCAEEVKEEAIVCRYCKRELTLFKLLVPMLEKMSLLEEKVSEISNVLAERTSAADAHPSNQPVQSSVQTYSPNARLTFMRRTLAIALPSMFMAISAWLLYSSGNTSFVIPLLFALVSPLPFGFWIGIAWRGRHLTSYILFGLCSGILGGVGMILGAFEFFEPPDDPYPWSTDLLYFLIVISITGFASATLFLSGGLFGDFIEKLRFPELSTTTSVARKIADKVDISNSQESASDTDQHERFILLLNTLGPAFLTLVGTIVSSTLAYAAARVVV